MTTHPFGGDSPLSSRLWGQAQPVPYTTRDCYQGRGKPSPYPIRCATITCITKHDISRAGASPARTLYDG